MKFLRAIGLRHELWNRWELNATASSDQVVTEISEDRRKVVFKISSTSSRPIDEFALIFGDMVHNFRSALDSLAWELTHMTDAVLSESEERKIYFPLCTTQKAWDAQVAGALSTVPPRFVAAMYELQPLHLPVPEDSAVLALHELDITDKHKASIRASQYTHNMGMMHFELRDENGDSIKSGALELVGPRAYADGEPLFQVATDREIATATTSMNVPSFLMITRKDGRTMEMWDFINAVHAYMEVVFDTVYKGIDVDRKKLGFK